MQSTALAASHILLRKIFSVFAQYNTTRHVCACVWYEGEGEGRGGGEEENLLPVSDFPNPAPGLGNVDEHGASSAAGRVLPGDGYGGGGVVAGAEDLSVGVGGHAVDEVSAGYPLEFLVVSGGILEGKGVGRGGFETECGFVRVLKEASSIVFSTKDEDR